MFHIWKIIYSQTHPPPSNPFLSAPWPHPFRHVTRLLNSHFWRCAWWVDAQISAFSGGWVCWGVGSISCPISQSRVCWRWRSLHAWSTSPPTPGVSCDWAWCHHPGSSDGDALGSSAQYPVSSISCSWTPSATTYIDKVAHFPSTKGLLKMSLSSAYPATNSRNLHIPAGRAVSLCKNVCVASFLA